MKQRYLINGIWGGLFLATLFIRNLNEKFDYIILILTSLSMAVIILLSINNQIKIDKKYTGFFFFALTIYLLLLFVNPLISKVPYHSKITACICAILPITFFSCHFFLATKKTNNNISLWIIWLPINALAIFGLHQAIAMGHRANGPFPDFNTYAALLYMAVLPLAAYCIGGYAGKKEWLSLILLCAGMAAANSKGAYVALGFSFVFLIVFIDKNTGRNRRILLVGLTLIMTFALVTSFPGPKRDYTDSSSEITPSISARVMMWESTLRAYVSENVYLGNGLNSYKFLYAQYRNPEEIYSSGDQAHNDYLQWLLEGGPILLLSLILAGPVLSFYALTRCKYAKTQKNKIELIGLSAACLALSVHALCNFIFKTPPLIFLDGFYLAYTVSIIRRSNPVTNNLLDFNIKTTKNRYYPIVIAFFAIAACFVLTRDGLIRWICESNKNQSDSLIVLNNKNLILLNKISPDNPYPINLLIEKLIVSAKIENDSTVKADKLIYAYSLVKKWIESDRFEGGAWLRAGEIARLDSSVVGGSKPSDFVGIALLYRPANFWIRNTLVRDLIDEGELKRSCLVSREGVPWVAGTPTLVVSELVRWANTSATVCKEFSDKVEMDFWHNESIKFLAK